MEELNALQIKKHVHQLDNPCAFRKNAVSTENQIQKHAANTKNTPKYRNTTQLNTEKAKRAACSTDNNGNCFQGTRDEHGWDMLLL